VPDVWLITGSSRGLGRALAEAVLAAGHQLVATARTPRHLDDLVQRYGDRVRAVALDVTDARAAERAVATVIETFGRLDVLVNNAGYGNVNSVEDTTIADFREQIETNLFGVIVVTKAALPHMRKQRSGRIIQISSIGGRVGPIGRAPYAAAKWGVEGFSEVLAKEVGPLGITVTIVEPGGFRTDFAGASTAIAEGRPEYEATVGKTARFQRDYDGKQPGDPAKAAAAIVQLAGLAEPPLRITLGSDALSAALDHDRVQAASDQKWRELSVSTDYPSTAGLDPDLQAALEAYRVDASSENWTRLSQMYCGLMQVLDAVKVADPGFPDPYPLAAADVAGDDFFQWPALPVYETVVEAVLAAQQKHDHS
jgi:NAD(P)-dependent dehydrogenase (short-subunit alcohol dehydrogenase family)